MESHKSIDPSIGVKTTFSFKFFKADRSKARAINLSAESCLVLFLSFLQYLFQHGFLVAWFH